jgi:hypothetical protein
MIFGVEEDESIRVHEGEISHEDEKEEDMVIKRLLCDEN